jgi:hypothetical protein
MSSRLANLALVACVGLVLACLTVPAAQASFGLEKFDVSYTSVDGSPATQAGSHPFAMTTTLYFNTLDSSHSDGEFRDGSFDQIVGLIGDPGAVPRCSNVDFLTIFSELVPTRCPDASAVGYAATKVSVRSYGAIYNLVPPPGVALKLGFIAYNTPVTIEVGLKDHYPYSPRAVVTNLPQSDPGGVLASILTLWGNPADPAHDSLRGRCVATPSQVSALPEFPEPPSHGDCPTNVPNRPFLTLPRSCQGPLASTYAIDSWANPGTLQPNGEPNLADPNWVRGGVLTHDNAVPPNPIGITGCSKLAFSPSITAQPTTKAAQSPTGLDFSLDIHDEGLTSPNGLANSDVKKAVVTLPEGMSSNPSIAEGLTSCSEADLARETVKSAPGEGCPNASKIGTAEVESSLLEESVNGALYIATPYENEVGSLLAFYLVIKNPTLGILVKQPMKVEPNPVTGQLTTVADNIPQLPFSHFRLHFREGTRSPISSPPACGSYDVKAVLTPWAGGAPVTTTSAFQIISGSNNGPCPRGGMPPFRPGLEAGTLNNTAGHYSPFYLRLSRNDGEQEITRFSIKLPPGIVGKLAGIPFCPDAAIAAAKARTGPHGAQEELNSPSCPAASEVGRSLAGAGVGPSLTYAPGKIYLAGPYHGSALSMAAITAAKVGPFDLGTVVIRQALKINPETAEVFIDSTNSDPIPHIIQGFPVHLRDIRAYVERPNFVLNPTNCKATSTASTLLGSGLNFASPGDDQPVTVTTRFQAADCASLGFKPNLSIRLKGGIKRGATPALRAVLTYPKNGYYANIAKSQVTLPHSEFLEQAHIRTICTRVQFAAGVRPAEKCPPGSIYGHAKAFTPLLDEPVEGPVYLRSSSNPLPDVVVALHSGKIDVNLIGRIDSVKNGQIRASFDSVPDAPVSKFVLDMQGGKKGLFVNSTNICARTNRAEANFTGQNGKVHNIRPPVKASCGGNKAKRRR